MIPHTIGSLFARVATSRQEKRALVYNSGAMTYGELLDAARSLAGVLARSGIVESSRVAILAENNALFVEAVLASSYLGAVFVPLNTRWSLREVKAALADLNCAALVFSSTYAPLVQVLVDEGAAPALLVGDDVIGGNCKIVSPSEKRQSRDCDFAPAHPDAELPGALLFTGGTTGKAKGALLSHGSFVLDAVADSKDQLLYGSESVFFSVAPLAHRAALSYLIKVLLSGGTFVMESHFDEESFLDIIEREGVTAAFVIPAPFIRKVAAAARSRRRSCPSVRVVMLGGSDVSVEEMCLAWEVFPNACIQRGYSHTENAAHTVERIFRDQFDPYSFDLHGIGLPRLFTRIQLRDEAGEPVVSGLVGEAYAQSPWQMLGYESEEERCQDWIRTGDLLVQNQDGSYSFMGRVKELIKTGGELVFCSEVQDVVARMPQVDSCAAFGRRDDVFGERVCIAVVLREGCELSLEEVQKFCSGKIAGYKKPRELDLVPEIPMTPTGKVDRRRLVLGVTAGESEQFA
ncbi:MAG: acyl--CoA ligase [Eggerthellaceae bacterium]|nr:acyl--CoA ligase [Eggerthellaceae bacterium]